MRSRALWRVFSDSVCKFDYSFLEFHQEKMKLRSGFRYNEPTIDFDEASRCWRLNKIKVMCSDGTWQGMFRYRG